MSHGRVRATGSVTAHATPRALVVAADAPWTSQLIAELQARGVSPLEARDAEEAARMLSHASIDLVFCDGSLRADCGLAVLAMARAQHPQVGRVLVSEHASGGELREAINEASVDYLLPRHWEPSELDAALAAAGRDGSEETTAAPRGHGEPFPRIVGESAAIRDLLALVARVGPTDSAVLVTGETGSGKELIGRAVHEASHRRSRAFCSVNSAAIPEALLESELFGHVRGSFPGATSHKKGVFERADRGTVFLYEVAEMPLSIQAKLLRFLQTGEIRPIGSASTRFVDLRLVTATSKDLLNEVEKGRFREDLYYRLAVIPLHVPPLRERVSDIPLLARHFLAHLARRAGQPTPALDRDALATLIAHEWPGNVRELRNVMERAVALSPDGRIAPSVMPRPGRPVRSQPLACGAVESLPVLERRHIIETLDRVGWNRKRAAELLQISTTTLWRRLKEFGVEGASLRMPRGNAATGSEPSS